MASLWITDRLFITLPDVRHHQSRMSQPQIYVAPGANEDSKRHFQQAVRTGIPRDTYKQYTDAALGETARVWGAATSRKDVWETLENGDYIFLYRGGGTYGDVVRVVGTEKNRKFGEYLWPEYAGPARESDSDYTLLVYCEAPQELDLSRDDLHDRGHYGNDYPRALTRLDDGTAERILDDYSSITDYIDAHSGEPQVWIEKTQLENREYKQEGGEFELGTAIISKSQDNSGRKRYETLREADVGDIVLHLLQDRHQLVGVSVIDSELHENFEGPPDNRWTEEQQAAGGYLRELADYEALDTPLDIYEDFLERDAYEDRLRRIREENQKIFYSQRLSLNQGHYFTRCPDKLTALFADASPDLKQLLADRGYEVQVGAEKTDATEYEVIQEATRDVLERLESTVAVENWIGSHLLEAVVRQWTSVIARNDLPANEISPEDLPALDRLRELYESNKQRLEEQAQELGVGTLMDLSPGQVLFVVFIRDLQERFDLQTNFEVEEMETVLAGDFYAGTEPLETLSEPPARGEEIRRQLTHSGQVVFHGPPGTSKTYSAQRFARWWLGECCDEPTTDQLEVVTFHPSFTYEDFVEGLTAQKQDDAVEYRVKDGVFKRMCERARGAYETYCSSGDSEQAPPYVLIIDEINRGHLSQIFGELITLLESDKRLGAENETRATLPHSEDETLVVPPNLYLIGTMNTADRSIALVDAALRRRFRFLHFPPETDALREAYDFGTDDLETVACDQTSPADALLVLSIMALDELNSKIRNAPELGRGKQLGHSFLFGIDRNAPPAEQIETIEDTWKFEILPLLEEYYFGQFEEIETTLFEGDAGGLLDSSVQEIADFDAVALASKLADLVSVRDEEWAWTHPDESGDTPWATIEYLLEEGVIEPGDELQFVIEKLPAESTSADEMADEFWTCTVTGKTGQQNNVQWRRTGEDYSISQLSQAVYEEATGESRDLSGTEWWSHTSHPDKTLYELRRAIETGEVVTENEASADD